MKNESKFMAGSGIIGVLKVIMLKHTQGKKKGNSNINEDVVIIKDETCDRGLHRCRRGGKQSS